MRILQVVTLLSPDGEFGGPARVALNQSAELVGRGHDVTIIGAGRGYEQLPTELDGVTVKLFTARTLLPRSGFSGVAAPGLRKWLRDNWAGFDVTHIHLGRDLVVLPVAVAARRRHMPYVVQTHGMVGPSKHPLARPLDRYCTRKVIRDAQAVFYLSAEERKHLFDVVGPGLALVELGNGVPRYPAAANATGRPEVLFAARMHPRKRPVAFVEMARTLLDAGVDARFALVGHDEGEGPAVMAAVGGDPRITWEGGLTPDAIPARMASARVYVLPSVREPLPMSVLEAMSVGLPVVVTNDCGLAPLVERSGCGIVTDPAVPALAAAVDAILGDSDMAQSMGERGRRTVRADYGMEAVGDRLLDTYSHVAESLR
ncbi:glycosyl transferase family 1 [Mycolicibacterium agri]|uniref:Glycosyl transferase family 1 n=1 Tax=Mycolicibacterium agri TaxID=36811 RepID=A0A2A7NHD2_MYCAG|nr:glycosyltransferase [Mycolicibacterium agri]PEG43183.1 glycosyl transferase family 1 [Mycolicibacterium agri]GFG54410.1 glycosyl transferase family 1 [Mycolicibacterium agri]